MLLAVALRLGSFNFAGFRLNDKSTGFLAAGFYHAGLFFFTRIPFLVD
jgi:hypothetical protein